MPYPSYLPRPDESCTSFGIPTAWACDFDNFWAGFSSLCRVARSFGQPIITTEAVEFRGSDWFFRRERTGHTVVWTKTKSGRWRFLVSRPFVSNDPFFAEAVNSEGWTPVSDPVREVAPVINRRDQAIDVAGRLAGLNL